MKTIKSGFRKVASGIKNAVRHIDNSVFCRLMKKPEVKSIDETIDYILKNNCSVSRFGDGELLMILGYRNGFQTYSRELAVRLEEVLKSNLSNHIVCLADMFGSLKKLNKESIKYNKKYLSKYRRKLYRIIPRKKEGGFYNTFFTRPYNMFRDKSDSARWFNNNKKI